MARPFVATIIIEMGSGSSKNSSQASSRPTSFNRPKREADDYDPDKSKPVYNWQGEIIGYIPL